MKKLLAAALASAFLAFAPQTQAQTPPNVLVVGQIAEPKSLDPHAVTAVNDFRILVNLYDGLTRYKDGTLEVEPSLAESWTISDDGKTYTFKLRDGVVFHDGTPFNAEAVKFNFDRMLNEEHPYHDTGPFPLSFFFSTVEDVVAEDDTTVTFRLSAPYAPVPVQPCLSDRPDRLAGGRQAARQGLRPQSFWNRVPTGSASGTPTPRWWPSGTRNTGTGLRIWRR